mmetsp:Transcript_23565/g.39521  ORF Transcript_23565/g.39521 Transcript_23565/m.39521 type:complete len:221 (+) Transcript_23565:4133-4795(+)
MAAAAACWAPSMLSQSSSNTGNTATPLAASSHSTCGTLAAPPRRADTDVCSHGSVSSLAFKATNSVPCAAATSSMYSCMVSLIMARSSSVNFFIPSSSVKNATVSASSCGLDRMSSAMVSGDVSLLVLCDRGFSRTSLDISDPRMAAIWERCMSETGTALPLAVRLERHAAHASFVLQRSNVVLNLSTVMPEVNTSFSTPYTKKSVSLVRSAKISGSRRK